MLKMKLIVKGRVQGVGFRHFILQSVQSQSPGLKGYVRNLPNGEVEIIAQGELLSLRQLKKYAQQGPPGGLVRDVVESFEEANEDLNSFYIKT